MEIGIIGAIIAAASLPYLWNLYYKQEGNQEAVGLRKSPASKSKTRGS